MFRIRKDGTGFLLLDTETPGDQRAPGRSQGHRVRRRSAAKPASLAGGQSDQPVPEPRPQPIPTVSTEITSIAIVDVSGAKQPEWRVAAPVARHAQKTPRGWSSDPAGRRLGHDLVALGRFAVHDVLPESGGTLLVGTGNKGKIYRLAGEPAKATLVTRADAQQVTSLLRDTKGGVWFATSNPGKMFRLASGQAHGGHIRIRYPRRRDGGDVGRHQLARLGSARHVGQALHAVGQHERPGRHLERVVGRL